MSDEQIRVSPELLVESLTARLAAQMHRHADLEAQMLTQIAHLEAYAAQLTDQLNNRPDAWGDKEGAT